jgi:hypothetical protein
LLEVLIAIFVMAIGMLSLLTLFPVGALSMAQALKDGRAAQAGVNAVGVAKVLNLAQDTTVQTALANSSAANPGGCGLAYVDPCGVASYTLPGTVAFPWFPRTTVTGLVPTTSPPTLMAEALRWCSVLDEIEFNPAVGTATPTAPLQRANRFTWAYLVKQAAPQSNIAFVSIAVYQNRPQITPPDETGSVYQANSYSVSPPPSLVTPAAKGSTTVVLNQVTPPSPWPPPIRSGTWILGLSQGDAKFYRVVATTTTANGLQIVLQSPLQTSINWVIVMEYVAEVFEAGLL